ncbi:C4-dicarboxylate ABC transporter [Oligella sp. HMSC05A10]|nr:MULTISPECIES: TAXI family TRAP transporter solute-binding subunit [Oligella]OFS84409.1 C4-dicarboxylate ABC transporter [Oligella sp. HMSC05A10]OFV46137.1 C4-dicarboxylate ABC transporter [Oligella sp. HMSC09E12]PMC19254.1 C4-dicarboxylate ABC transporter [Oligella urethralis]SUA62893.1 ABC-type taurine transport system, periplasmic component [Oligella urethralis]
MALKKWLIGVATSAMLVVSGSALAQKAQFVTVLTGGQSGVYYPVGVALAQHYAENIPNVRATAQVTKASAENMNLLQAGRGEIGFSLADTVEDAWNGREEAGFKAKLDKLRGVSRLYNNYVHIIVNAESGIDSLDDLKGKRISVGAARSGTELNARAIFKAAGLEYGDFSKVEYLSFGESVELMKNRQIDATLQSAGLGVASIRDLASAVKIKVIPISKEVLAKIDSQAYVADVIPANTYDGQSEDVPTAAIPNYLVTHSGVSDDLAYEMTKVLYEKLDNLKNAHNAINAMDIKQAVTGMPVPLHPGAEKFYKEKGIIE